MDIYTPLDIFVLLSEHRCMLIAIDIWEFEFDRVAVTLHYVAIIDNRPVMFRNNTVQTTWLGSDTWWVSGEMMAYWSELSIISRIAGSVNHIKLLLVTAIHDWLKDSYFLPLQAVYRYCDPQLQVGENYLFS